MAFDLGGLLSQFNQANGNPQQAEEQFDQIAQAAPQDQLSSGLSQAFRSDQTPPFPQMAAQLFGNSNPNQQAGMLNQILGSLGPGVLSSIAGSVLGGGMGGALGGLLGGNQSHAQAPQITPEQASQLSPEQVRQLAEQAEQHNPSVVDRMGDFYAQHPGLVKGLGGAALAIALGHMAQGMKRN